MPESRSFSAPIEEASGGGAYVTVPFDVEAAFGRKRVPVNATIDGVPYRGSLVRMGGDCHVLGVLKSIRDRLGKRPGDIVDVTLEADDEPRVIDVPSDLREALELTPGAAAVFDRLSYTHKREYVTWILEAKRDATRVRRVARAVEMIARGQPRR